MYDGGNAEGEEYYSGEGEGEGGGWRRRRGSESISDGCEKKVHYSNWDTF